MEIPKSFKFTDHIIEMYSLRGGVNPQRAAKELARLLPTACPVGITSDGQLKLKLTNGAYVVSTADGLCLTCYWRGQGGNRVEYHPTLGGYTRKITKGRKERR